MTDRGNGEMKRSVGATYFPLKLFTGRYCQSQDLEARIAVRPAGENACYDFAK
jgi:hypothetical protein